MNAEQLEIREPRGEKDADPRPHDEQPGDDRVVRDRGLNPDDRDDEHIEIKEDAPSGDRHSEEARPATRVDCLARADAASQRSDHAQLVQREIQRDERPDHREHRDRHPLGHVFGAGAGDFAFSESTIAFSSSYPSEPGYSLFPMMKLGVAFTLRRSASASFALILF